MKKIRKVMTRKNGFILAFLLPGILLFGIIYAYPLVNIFMTSFCKWNYKNFLKPAGAICLTTISNYLPQTGIFRWLW